MTIDILKKHQLILTSDISSICKPLVELGIDFFHYVRKFKDNSRISISNKPEWIEYFYDKHFYLAGPLEGKNELYNSSYFLWETLKGQEIYTDAREYFNIDHGITIIKPLPDSIEFVHFASNRHNQQVINFYLSNIDFLNRFTLYFKDQAKPLINQALRNKIYPPNINLKPNPDDLKIINHGHIALLAQKQQEFLRATKIKHYQIHSPRGPVNITAAEVECLLGLLEGETAPETGSRLGKSKRTVETHLDHLKQKFDCHTKSELIKKLIAKGFVFQEKLWQIFI